MIGWILLVLLLFFVQTLLATVVQYVGAREGRGQRIKTALGPRDDPPPMPQYAQRAARALKNMFEALPIFLSLAFLCLVLGLTDPVAEIGAAIFFFARLAYVPCYVFGVSGVRSAVWVGGLAGLLVMLAAILRAMP